MNKYINKSYLAGLILLASLFFSPGKAFSSNVHVLQLSLANDTTDRIMDFALRSLRQDVLDMKGQWTSIAITSEKELIDKLESLDKNSRFTHMIVGSHGDSSLHSLSLWAGNSEIGFDAYRSPESNPFYALRGRFTNHPKIFLTGCNVFAGAPEHANYKAGLVARVLGIEEGDIFGSESLHYAALNLFPPLTLCDFPRQLGQHAVMTTEPLAKLVLKSFPQG